VNRDELPDDLVLSEAQVREVIELAARAAPRSEGVTLSDLRQIAQELDIEEAALEDALRVVLAKQPRSRPIRSWVSKQATRLGRALSRFLPQKRRWIAGGLVGGLLGWFCAYVEAAVLDVVINGVTHRRGSGFFIDAPVLTFLILLTLANSLARRVDGRRGRYLGEMVAAWSAFLVAWSVTHGHVTNDGIRFTLICLTALGLWGWWIIHPPRNRENDLLEMQARYDRVLRRASEKLDDLSSLRFGLREAGSAIRKWFPAAPAAPRSGSEAG